MTWLRESISDEAGMADIAYISIAIIVAMLFVSVLFLCAMSAVSYSRCTVIADVGQGVRAAIPCSYDPNPLALGIAAIVAAFGSPIGALAGYMVATRRREKAQNATTTTTATATAVTTEGGKE